MFSEANEWTSSLSDTDPARFVVEWATPLESLSLGGGVVVVHRVCGAGRCQVTAPLHTSAVAVKPELGVVV